MSIHPFTGARRKHRRLLLADSIPAHEPIQNAVKLSVKPKSLDCLVHAKEDTMRIHPLFVSLNPSSASGVTAARSSKFTVSRTPVLRNGRRLTISHRRRHTTVFTNVAMNSSSSRPEYDKDRETEGGVDPEDEALNSELQAKVNELFGGRQNVRIDLNTDASQVQFTLRDPSLSQNASAVDRFRSPKYILTFIAIVSLVTGTFFTALYMSGYVHGLDTSDDSHYEMPTYGKESYIDPYQLLQKDYIEQVPAQPQQPQQPQQPRLQ